MSVAAGVRVTGEAPRIRIRPRFRGRELGLLLLVALGLFLGSLSLGATEQLRAAIADGESSAGNLLVLADAGILVVYLGALFLVHLVFVVAGRRTDQILLPAVGLLGGIGLLLMERLPQDLAGSLGGLARTQLVWLLIGFIFYFAYGKSHSRLNAPPPEMPEGISLHK